MSTQACRDALKKEKVALDKGAHAGLLLSRYLQIAAPTKGNDSKDEEKQHPGERLELYRLAKKAAERAKSIYVSAYDRRLQYLKQDTPCAESFFSVQGRLIVGLGSEHVLEAGITLHHTYGVPIIPGSALKGLAAHYCDQVWGNESVYQEGSSTKQDAYKFKLGEEWHRALFGTSDDSGHIIFHEAWITPESLNGDGKQGLVLDVMTPHHGDYYTGEKDKHGNTVAPTDFDDPNPITFLSVTGTIHVALSCDVDSDVGEKWTKLAMRLLTEALQRWGVGGKTNAGYGRLKLSGPLVDVDQLKADAVIASVRALKFAGVAGSIYAYVELWRNLEVSPAQKRRVAEAIVAKVIEAGREKQSRDKDWYKELLVNIQ